MASCREKGLCFNYDEKFTRGHKFSLKFFVFIIDDDEKYDPSSLNSEQTELFDSPNSSSAQISLHALSRHLALEMLCLVSDISSQQVVILIDDGSTHSFIQKHLVSVLGLPTNPTHPLRVMVGNESKIECHECYEEIILQI